MTEIIKEEGLKNEDFRIRELKASFPGGKRKAFIKAKVGYKIGKVVNLTFQLSKGSYATVLLREITK